MVIRGQHYRELVAPSGLFLETGARSGWFVALSGKSALSRGSLVAYSGHWGEISTLMIRGSVGAESGRSRGRSRRYS